MIVVIDNYDSFTYNLVQYIGCLGFHSKVLRNDQTDIEQIRNLHPSHIVISPGPRRPKNAGISIDVVKSFFDRIPILGVCLGHQAISEGFGGETVYAPHILHGKACQVFHHQKGLFKYTPNPFCAGRYHSLLVDKDNLPSCLEVTAWSDENIIMGVAHKQYPTYGVQFHPESILTDKGMSLIQHFLDAKGKEKLS